MPFLNAFFWAALVLPPAFIAYIWWTRLRTPHAEISKWRNYVFLSALFAATTDLLLLWSWVIWLALHRGTPGTYKVWDKMSDIALCLLLYAIPASLTGKGKSRILLALSAFLSILPWIPVGVL